MLSFPTLLLGLLANSLTLVICTNPFGSSGWKGWSQGRVKFNSREERQYAQFAGTPYYPNTPFGSQNLKFWDFEDLKVTAPGLEAVTVIKGAAITDESEKSVVDTISVQSELNGAEDGLSTSMIVELVSSETNLDVPTRFGKVRGQYSNTRGGKSILEFLGIPYAKPPVGNLRFKNPEWPAPWTDVLNTTSECAACMQQFVLIEAVRNVVSGSEDCLCLNVFTPERSAIEKLPVIVFIHGGAYLGLSSAKENYGPELLLDRDVVLVTMNYRVGVFGFLSTGDSRIPGNFGMKDQALALRWVTENIAAFGGDPSSITLMGQSSGAASVHLHMLSPLSRDLFHKAIQQSATAFNPWAFSPPEVLQGRSSVVAEMVGCHDTPASALLQCLQRVQAETLANTTQTFTMWDLDPLNIWTPTVEELGVEGAFITEHPRDCQRQDLTKPLLIGYNNAEGGFKTTSVLSGDSTAKFSEWNARYDELTTISLMYNNTFLDRPGVSSAIRKFYFGSDNAVITPDMLRPITDMYGDDWFIIGILDFLETYQGQKYFYYFNHNSSVSLCGVFLNSPLNLGACHFDELMYLFPMGGNAPKYDPQNEDYLLSVKLVDMWTNFAKSSDPATTDVEWTAVESDALEYLEILNHNSFGMKSSPVEERRRFWASIS